MLAIRLQRIGRKKLAHYRLIAQEHRIQPTSGKVAAYLGSYNPHTKDVNLDKEKIEYYLSNGAQPSNSAAKLMQSEGISLPEWVKITQKPDRKEAAQAAAAEEAPAEAEEAAAPAGAEMNEEEAQNSEASVEDTGGEEKKAADANEDEEK